MGDEESEAAPRIDQVFGLTGLPELPVDRSPEPIIFSQSLRMVGAGDDVGDGFLAENAVGQTATVAELRGNPDTV